MDLLVTLVPGLEGVSIQEAEEITGETASKVFEGALKAQGDQEDVFKLNYLGKTFHRVYIDLAEGEFEGLDEIYEDILSVNFADYIYPTQSFAVRSEIEGEQDFSSMDLERKVGQAVVDSFKEEKGERLEVDLDDPNLVFKIIIKKDKFFFGLDTTGEHSLKERGYRSYDHPSKIDPTIASAMIKLSGWKKEDSFTDLMCGSGTIPIEAVHRANKIPNWFRDDYAFWRFFFLNREDLLEKQEEIDDSTESNKLSVYGFDKVTKHIKGAEENAEKARVDYTTIFTKSDSTKEVLDYDYIVTNFPYSKRKGNKEKAKEIYEKLLENIKKYEWERAVFLVGFPEVFPSEDLKLVKAIDLDYGENNSSVLVIEK